MICAKHPRYKAIRAPGPNCKVCLAIWDSKPGRKAVRRFSYITAPAGSVLHLAFGKLLEGEPVACGIRIQPKWRYASHYTLDKEFGKRPVCKRCVAA